MKRLLNIRRLMPVLLLLMLIAVCGTVYAYMFMRTPVQISQFFSAKVACQVSESFADNTKRDIKVENTGKIDAYLRIRLVTYWVDANGNVAAKSSPMLNITPAAGWVAGSENVFYYVVPVEPNATTLRLSDEPISLREEDGFKQVIDVFAEAIQAEPANAVINGWGVTLASDGKTIASAP